MFYNNSLKYIKLLIKDKIKLSQLDESKIKDVAGGGSE